jgi:hypothetical protein
MYCYVTVHSIMDTDPLALWILAYCIYFLSFFLSFPYSLMPRRHGYHNISPSFPLFLSNDRAILPFFSFFSPFAYLSSPH